MAPGPQPTACPRCAVLWHPWVLGFAGLSSACRNVFPNPGPLPSTLSPQNCLLALFQCGGTHAGGSPPHATPRCPGPWPPPRWPADMRLKGARAPGSCPGGLEETFLSQELRARSWGGQLGAGRRTGRATRGAQEVGTGRAGPRCPWLPAAERRKVRGALCCRAGSGGVHTPSRGSAGCEIGRAHV